MSKRNYDLPPSAGALTFDPADGLRADRPAMSALKSEPKK